MVRFRTTVTECAVTNVESPQRSDMHRKLLIAERNRSPRTYDELRLPFLLLCHVCNQLQLCNLRVAIGHTSAQALRFSLQRLL